MTSPTRSVAWGITGGALMGALGWWLPWVLPSSGAAALVLLGLDLGEFWKFTSEWRNGLLEVERLFYFLPPPLGGILLAWVVGQRASTSRWLALPFVLFLCLVILPSYDLVLIAFGDRIFTYPTSDLARQYGFQLYLATTSLLLSLLLIGFGRRLPALPTQLLALVVALSGAALPAWAHWRAWLVLQGLYNGSALPGPGTIITSGGFILAALAIICPAIAKRRK